MARGIDHGKIFREILRTALAPFVQRAHHEIEPTQNFVSSAYIDVLCDQLERIERGEIVRQIINLPPRHLKSIIVSVCFVAWILGRDPGRRIILVSYGSELVERHVRLIRQIMRSQWYRATFPGACISKSKDTITAFETTLGGRVYGTTIEGALTGHGGGMIIVDDPIKAGSVGYETQQNRVNDWVSNTLLSRLDDKSKDQVIVVMQRLHVNDLSGFLLDRGGWNHLCLPALAIEREVFPYGRGKTFERNIGEPLFPEREGIEVLEAIRREMGSYDFSSQYQQQPVPREGHLLRVDWLKYYTDLPAPHPYDELVQVWDLGVKDGELNDYSACVTIQMVKGDFYVLNIWHGRLLYPELQAKIVALAGAYKPNRLLIEDAATGPAMIADLRRQTSYSIIAVRSEGVSKNDRINAQSPKIESGKLFLPKNATWLNDFLAEYRAFPRGRHDDMLDALAYGLNYRKGRGSSNAHVVSIESPLARAARHGTEWHMYVP